MSLKKFEILEMVAKGGMAEVYRAKTVGFQGFEKEVCVKKILPHLTEDESFVHMFVNEAKLAATLNYANIVQVHDLCVSAGGEYFIVMEYVQGKDLSDVIRAAQLAGREIPTELAIYVCREMCKGLYYAHSKTDSDGAPLNIIHRDISPHNVLISFMGEVKITDFGIAKASSIVNKTAVGILKGKYGYMSPEQARGQPLDHRSDIFNSGIVLYETLVAERCFAGSSDFSTLNLMRNAEVTPPTKVNAGVPKEMEAIVLKALAREPNDRFKDALELERALSDYAKRHPPVAGATELADFMRALFVSEDRRSGDPSTGVLSLASVVGPPPAPPLRDPKPFEAAPKSAPAEAAAPPAKAADDSSGPAPEKKERKPARIKAPAGGDEPEKKAKKKKKKKEAVEKKPVGRRELVPGLTRIRALERAPARRRLLKAALWLLVAGGLGAGLGTYRAAQVSREAAFREAENHSRGVPKKSLTVLIESEPPGATVRLDNIELSERAPVAVERDRDANEHEVELSLDGYRSTKRTFSYASGVLTLLREPLEGRTRKVEVETEPADLEVRVDGKEMGELSIRSMPRARIYLDGRPTERWTNDGALPLLSDVEHRVSLRVDPEKDAKRLLIRLKNGEKKEIFLDLSEPS